ncbi:MAG: peptidoglycan-binding domain-containing protein, partial [Phenylobacterium sp.]
GTAAAVKDLQKAAGLKETGIPDPRTLVALFYSGPARADQAPRPAAAAAPAAPKEAPAPAAGQSPAKLDLNLIPKTP